MHDDDETHIDSEEITQASATDFMTHQDHELTSALIGQVGKAVPKGENELSVTTLITRPMWEAWCRACNLPEDSEPTEWLGSKETIRVYGSRTIVIESDMMASVSFAQLKDQQ
jgi:hypothetical protein